MPDRSDGWNTTGRHFFVCWAALVLTVVFSLSAPATFASDPVKDLAREIHAIDADSAAELGVYIKHLGTGEVVTHQADRLWYLASTIKVPLAIAVLQTVEEKRLTLQDQIVLKKSDFVDGAGDLLYHQPGTRFSVAELLEKSIRNSDSTATDMLIRLLGEKELNRRIRESMVGEGFRPFTTILQVRYDAYSELHPRADELSNIDFLELRSAGGTDARVRAFRRKLGLGRDQLKVSTLEKAFERYYERNTNSGTLVAFGLLLEKLVRGELLTDRHTELLFSHMGDISTGDKRLSAGLPEWITFIQKTGTQIERACNVGVIRPHVIDDAVVIAACAEKFGDIHHAEQAFRKIAEALKLTGWWQEKEAQ